MLLQQFVGSSLINRLPTNHVQMIMKAIIVSAVIHFLLMMQAKARYRSLIMQPQWLMKRKMRRTLITIFVCLLIWLLIKSVWLF